MDEERLKGFLEAVVGGRRVGGGRGGRKAEFGAWWWGGGAWQGRGWGLKKKKKRLTSHTRTTDMTKTFFLIRHVERYYCDKKNSQKIKDKKKSCTRVIPMKFQTFLEVLPFVALEFVCTSVSIQERVEGFFLGGYIVLQSRVQISRNFSGLVGVFPQRQYYFNATNLLSIRGDFSKLNFGFGWKEINVNLHIFSS